MILACLALCNQLFQSSSSNFWLTGISFSSKSVSSHRGLQHHVVFSVGRLLKWKYQKIILLLSLPNPQQALHKKLTPLLIVLDVMPPPTITSNLQMIYCVEQGRWWCCQTSLLILQNKTMRAMPVSTSLKPVTSNMRENEDWIWRGRWDV